MHFYETVIILRQDMQTAQAEALIDRLQEYLTSTGGRIARREYWGLRNFAYRIGKNRKGHYTLLNYEATHAAVQEMERNMRISEEVLRYLTLRTETLPVEPSAVMRRREERGGSRERGERDRFPDRGDRGDRPDRGDRGPGAAGRDRPADRGARRPAFGREERMSFEQETEGDD